MNREYLKETIRISWPSVLESFFTALAGIIDSLMVSRLGTEAVAAVGLTTQPKFITLAVFFAINVAISALVARRLGEGRRKDANRILSTAMAMIIVLSAAISVAAYIFADPIIRFCGSAEDTHSMAVIYFRVIVAGTIFNAMQMGINSAQRGAGNTRITMITNIVSSLVNICFNYLLIEGHLGFPRLEVFGAALATVLGTVVSCIISICSLFRKDSFLDLRYIIKDRLLHNKESLSMIFRVGYSVFFEQIMFRVGFLFCAIVAAKQGTENYAAHQVATNMLVLSFAFGDGLQAASVALIGRSLGEGAPDKAKAYGRLCRLLGYFFSVILGIIYITCGRAIFGWFFDDPHTVDICEKISYYAVPAVFLQIQSVIYTGSLRGAGDTAYTAIVSTISAALVRTSVCYIAATLLHMGIYGVWVGTLADIACRLVLSAIRYFQGKWIMIKI